MFFFWSMVLKLGGDINYDYFYDIKPQEGKKNKKNISDEIFNCFAKDSLELKSGRVASQNGPFHDYWQNLHEKYEN